MRETGFPSVLVRDFAAGSLPFGCGLGVLARSLTAGGIVVCGDPADGDLILSTQDAGADLRGGDGEPLSRADGVHPHPVDGGREVHGDGVPVVAFLTLVQDAGCPVDGVYFQEPRPSGFSSRAEGQPPSFGG